MNADLVFDANTNRNCIDVTTTEDDIYDGSEVFAVNLVTADMDVTISPNGGEITVLDDDGIKPVIRKIELVHNPICSLFPKEWLLDLLKHCTLLMRLHLESLSFVRSLSRAHWK